MGIIIIATTQEILTHHLTCFGAGDLEGILSDYSEDIVFFLPDGPIKGPAAMKPFFEAMFAEFSKPGITFELHNQSVEGDYAYIFWSADTPDNTYEAGTDTFVIRDGKIVAQSFSANITPKAAK
jgi:ketosteroid isomerase-like protein